MAVVEIGVDQISFDTKADVVLPPVVIDGNDGHAFILEAQPLTSVTKAGYCNVFFLIDSTEGTVITPLVTKWFPSGFPMLFYFGFPRSFVNSNRPCRMLLRPKEFSPGLEQNRLIAFRASWDDQARANANNVSYPNQ